MGVGDALMASGEVRALRKKRPGTKFIIGDGIRYYWNEVFDHNPHIIKGIETKNYKNIIWIKNYEGNRPYRNYGSNYPKENYNWKKFTPKRGEIFFSKEESELSNLAILNIKKKIGEKKLIFVEPNLKKRLGYENRDWGFSKWQQVVSELKNKYEFIQISYGKNQVLDGVINIHGLNFRNSVGILSNCDLFIGTEGGMHHAAAATSRKAIVVFGGHISPDITGYKNHTNLYVDSEESPCGKKDICKHCIESMKKITCENMIGEIENILN